MNALYSAGRFLTRAIGVLTGWDVRGREHMPRDGGLIVAANHISFWDPTFIGSAMSREFHFLAKEELFSTPVLGAFIRRVNSIPIRRGAADLRGLTQAIEALKSGGVVLLFPEGSRMRDGELHPARPGVGLLSVHADVPIMPCYISGSGRPGLWWLRRRKVRIEFGPPHDWREYAGPGTDLTPGRALYQRIGESVMRDIAAIRDAQNKATRGAATRRLESSTGGF